MAWNATLSLTDGTIKTIRGRSTYVYQNYDINLVNFATAVETQYDSAQVRKGRSWFPIRRGEVQVQFSIDWPLISIGTPGAHPRGFENIPYSDGFKRLHKFQNAIRRHQQVAALSKDSPPPMILTYNNNSNSVNFNPLIGKQKTPLVYRGWIDVVTKPYIRFQNIFRVNYRMNVLTDIKDNIASLTQHQMVTRNGDTGQMTNYSYAPTPRAMLDSGRNWTAAEIDLRPGVNISLIPGGK